MTAYATFTSPIGELLAVADRGSLTHLHMLDAGRSPAIAGDWRHDEFSLAHVRRQLGEYFAGERREFDLDLAPRGSEFERAVWDELLRIPYGATRSYGEVARAIGRPDRARAVGAANARNPIAIVIPCHRVIGADGSLTGYAGGLERKRALLELESGTAQLALTG